MPPVYLKRRPKLSSGHGTLRTECRRPRQRVCAGIYRCATHRSSHGNSRLHSIPQASNSCADLGPWADCCHPYSHPRKRIQTSILMPASSPALSAPLITPFFPLFQHSSTFSSPKREPLLRTCLLEHLGPHHSEDMHESADSTKEAVPLEICPCTISGFDGELTCFCVSRFMVL